MEELFGRRAPEIRRRALLGGAAAFTAIAAFPAAARQRANRQVKARFAYVGSYTSASKPAGHGEGITLWRVEADTGALAPVKIFAGPSPTWLAFDPKQRFLYAANETDEFNGAKAGSVSAFGVDRDTGELTLINTVSSEGAGPAHRSVHPSGRFVFVANYGGGNIAVLRVGQNGGLGAAVDVKGDEGPPGNGRPIEGAPGNFSISDHDGPHAHMIASDPSGNFVLANDLGLDRTFVWRLDTQSGKLTPADPPFVPAASPGAGPRHFAFHPNGRIFYNLYEEASQLAVYDWDARKGTLSLKQKTTTLPGYEGTNYTSEIVITPNGRTMYLANRLHNSVAIFSVGSDGRVRWLAEEWTRGDYPRNIALDPSGRFLYVCNHRSDNVTAFRVHGSTGALTFLDKYVAVGSPAVITFLD
ncbi:MAG: lactonase family protein [Hyphomicrobiales bacterium]|nr:lactonase family protein [Hyphomicrobiales bacterium]